MAVITLTDRPKSVLNCCVIEFLVAVWCWHFLLISVVIRAFVIGLSQISFFSRIPMKINLFFVSSLLAANSCIKSTMYVEFNHTQKTDLKMMLIYKIY